MTDRYKYIIIGGGPSGAAAATLLASGGAEVCIVEKKKFPREILCGEFLSAEVTGFLKQQGLWGKFLMLNPQKIKSFRLINSNGKELYSELNFVAYALKRSALDNLLLGEAINKGSVLLCPAEVINLTYKDEKILLNINDDTDNKIFSAETVIAAYGRNNLLDKKLGRSFTSTRSGISGVKFHLNKDYFITPPEGEIQIYTAGGIYCGINPVNENDYTVCFLADRGRNPNTPKEHIKFLQKTNKRFAQLFSPEFEKIFPGIKFYGTSNLFFREKEKYIKGIYFSGDAAGIIAPLAGDGIGMAFQCAQLLADHLIKGKEPREYDREWKKLFSSRLKTAKLIQNLLLNSSVRGLAISTAAVFPSLLNYFIRQTRASK